MQIYMLPLYSFTSNGLLYPLNLQIFTKSHYRYLFQATKWKKQLLLDLGL